MCFGTDSDKALAVGTGVGVCHLTEDLACLTQELKVTGCHTIQQQPQLEVPCESVSRMNLQNQSYALEDQIGTIIFELSLKMILWTQVSKCDF